MCTQAISDQLQAQMPGASAFEPTTTKGKKRKQPQADVMQRPMVDSVVNQGRRTLG